MYRKKNGICQQTFVGQVGGEDEAVVYLSTHTLPEKLMCNVFQSLPYRNTSPSDLSLTDICSFTSFFNALKVTV